MEPTLATRRRGRERDEASGEGPETTINLDDPLVQRVQAMSRRAAERSRDRAEAAESAAATIDVETGPEKASHVASDDALVDAFVSSAPVEQRLQRIERRLAKCEQDGLFLAVPMRPGSEFPSIMARLPIFMPTRRQRQKLLQDEDNALPFETPFGDGRRHGPPLTVRDEDTLIALMRLRSRKLYGKPGSLPAKIAESVYRGGEGGNVGVHCVVCSVDQIVREMGLSNGGPNFKRTLASVKRLTAVRLELNLRTHERYIGETVRGRMFDLIDVEWEVHETHGVLVVIFSPVMAKWLEREYTYLDWNVRRALGDLGKALHRYLSSQPRTYRGDVVRICDTIGYDGPARNRKQRLRVALDELVEQRWLERYEFTGSGRSTPLVLTTWRASARKDGKLSDVHGEEGEDDAPPLPN